VVSARAAHDGRAGLNAPLSSVPCAFHFPKLQLAVLGSMALYRTALLTVALLATGCDSKDEPPGGGADLAADNGIHDLGGGDRDMARGGGDHDGGPSCSASSPSGYACDPWSTHLYVTVLAKRQGSTLQLKVLHSPDFEGSVEDEPIPPEHDYGQQLTVDIALTDSVRQFVCVVFTAAATPTSFDASGPTFLTDVDPGWHGLLPETFPNPPPVADLIDICGPTLPALRAPSFVTNGKPILPAIALAIPLTPSPRQFQVGTTFGAWLARGVLNIDEESELSPQLTAKVVNVE
jgi:hypothetical protein